MWLGDASAARELLLEGDPAGGGTNLVARTSRRGTPVPAGRRRSRARGLPGTRRGIRGRPDAQRLALRGHVPGPARARLVEVRGLDRGAARGNCGGYWAARRAGRVELAAAPRLRRQSAQSARHPGRQALRARPQPLTLPTSTLGRCWERRGESCGTAPTPGRWSPPGGEQRAEAMRTRQEGLIEPLTDRELTILRSRCLLSTLRELASALFVMPNTLKTHLRAIYRKLGAESRQEAVIRAHERGLI